MRRLSCVGWCCKNDKNFCKSLFEVFLKKGKKCECVKMAETAAYIGPERESHRVIDCRRVAKCRRG